jgi:hypothetical protein
MTADFLDPAQITRSVELSGDGVQLAKQFRDHVLHPTIEAICKSQDDRQVVAFLSCLLLQCALDLRTVCGNSLAHAAIDEVREQLAKTAATASH